MRSHLSSLIGCFVLCIAVNGGMLYGQSRERLLSTISSLEETAWTNAQHIWDWAEPGYQEIKSAGLLANWLESEGFRVDRSVADIPTAFTATIGTGKPVIAIIGEYDALPGLSQTEEPYQSPREGQSYGHGCGHHLFGVASATASIALGREIQAGNLHGTIRFYGCPAEEGGSAKVFMVRAGLFADVDVALHWHPSAMNAAGDRSSLARIAAKFRFFGRSAHAAGAPDQARSALDAVELMNFGTQLMREHVPEKTRIHYVITAGGNAPNVVPDFAEVYYYVRHPNSQVVREIYERVVKCARAGALATETELEISNEGGILELMPNNTLSEIAMRNLKALNQMKYSATELEFALKLQTTLTDPKPVDSIQNVINRSGEIGMGSTDVGDISWVVPTTGFNTACWVPGTPGHSWQAVACGTQPMARTGMMLASQVLAVTALDLITAPETIQSAKTELQRRLGDLHYEPLVTPDQQPPLNYRNPTNGSRRLSQ